MLLLLLAAWTGVILSSQLSNRCLVWNESVKAENKYEMMTEKESESYYCGFETSSRWWKNRAVTKCSIEPTLLFPEVKGDYDCQEREVEVVCLARIFFSLLQKCRDFLLKSAWLRIMNLIFIYYWKSSICTCGVLWASPRAAACQPVIVIQKAMSNTKYGCILTYVKVAEDS